jgi:hypothetical protein
MKKIKALGGRSESTANETNIRRCTRTVVDCCASSASGIRV